MQRKMSQYMKSLFNKLIKWLFEEESLMDDFKRNSKGYELYKKK